MKETYTLTPLQKKEMDELFQKKQSIEIAISKFSEFIVDSHKGAIDPSGEVNYDSGLLQVSVIGPKEIGKHEG